MASKRRCKTASLLAQHPPDDEQRLDQHSQVGEVLDQLPDARLELDRPDLCPP